MTSFVYANNNCYDVKCPCGAAVRVGPKCLCPECPSSCTTKKDCLLECASEGLELETTQQDHEGCDVCICRCKSERNVCPSNCLSGKFDIERGTISGIDGCITSCKCKLHIVEENLIEDSGITCPSLNCENACRYGFSIEIDQTTGCQRCACKCPPVISKIVCEHHCKPFGIKYVKDSYGCDACVCDRDN
ncbi:hypothetical protein ABK040_011141 [Willaertia magna]